MYHSPSTGPSGTSEAARASPSQPKPRAATPGRRLVRKGLVRLMKHVAWVEFRNDRWSLLSEASTDLSDLALFALSMQYIIGPSGSQK